MQELTKKDKEFRNWYSSNSEKISYKYYELDNFVKDLVDWYEAKYTKEEIENEEFSDRLKKLDYSLMLSFLSPDMCSYLTERGFSKEYDYIALKKTLNYVKHNLIVGNSFIGEDKETRLKRTLYYIEESKTYFGMLLDVDDFILNETKFSLEEVEEIRINLKTINNKVLKRN